jgi:tetratricopeptide (TPR) repeat protein/GTP-binding protein EngB required for normal cell division
MSIFDKLTNRVGQVLDEVTMPDDARRSHDRAARAMERGEFETGLETLRRSLVRYPNIARTHVLIGMCHMERDEWQEARDALLRGIDLRATGSVHLYAAISAEKLGLYREALAHLQQARASRDFADDALELSRLLGRIYLGLHRPDRAVKELEKVAAAAPNDDEVALDLVDALIQKGAVADAAEVFADRPGLSESTPRARTFYARIQERLEDPSSARAAWEAVLLVAPNSREARLGAARTALLADDTHAADRHLDALGDLPAGTDREEADVLRARSAFLKGDYEKARRAWETAAEANSARLDARVGAAEAALELDDIDAASAHFEGVVDQHPGDPHEVSALRGLAEIRLRHGDLTGARHLLDEASRLASRPSAAVSSTLGRVALAAGDPVEAAAAFQMAHDYAASTAAAERHAADRDAALERVRPEWELPTHLDDPLGLTDLLEQLHRYVAADPRLTDFEAPIRDLVRAMDRPLSLAIVGEFNAGKSTLLNAIVGEDVLPMGVLPTTAHTGILHWGPRKAARIVDLDGEAAEVTFAEAREQMKTNADAIDRIEITYPHPMLRVVRFWDTPGFNALDERHEDVASRALADAEAILWVMDANQVLSDTELDKIEGLRGGDERLLVVINKIDRLGPPGARDAAVDELVAYVEDEIGDLIAGVFPLSAKQAFEGDDAQGFGEFRDFLDERIVQRAGRIKVGEAHRRLEAIMLTLDAFQKGLVGKFQRLADEVSEVGDWLETAAESGPPANVDRHVEMLEDRVNFVLEVVEREIAESLKPTGGIIGGLQLAEDDRPFVLQLLRERLVEVMERSRHRILSEVVELEQELAERLDPIMRGLHLSDRRALARRLEGFYDETRLLRLLFDERLFGALAARTEGRIDAGGARALAEIEGAPQNRTIWRQQLQALVPPIGEGFAGELRAWYDDYFEAAGRFIDRTRRDLQLLQLDAENRYDVSVVSGVL